MKNYIIIEDEGGGKYTPLKGMKFAGYEAAMKTCIRLSVIHKEKNYLVYDKENSVQYHIKKLFKDIG